MSLLDAVQTARGSSSVSPTSKPTSSGTSSLLDAVQVARGGASVIPTPTASPKPIGTVSIAKPQNESLLSKIGGYVASNLNSIIAKIPSNTQDKVKMATNIASKIVTEQPQIKTLVKVARKPVVKKYAEDTVALGIDAIKKGVDTIKGAGQLTAPYQIYRAAIGNPVKPQEFVKSVVEFGLDIIGLQWRLNPLAPVVGAKMSQEKQLRQMAQNGKLKWDDVLKLAVGGVAGPIGRAAAGASIVGSESLVEGVNTQPGVGETFTDNVKLAQAIDIIFLGTMFVAPIAEAKVVDLNVKASNFLDRIKPLDISPNATMKEVTEAVRSKMKLHPDAFTNNPTQAGMKARTEITDALNAFKEAGFIDKKYAQAFDFFAKKLGIDMPPLSTGIKETPKQITDGNKPLSEVIQNQGETKLSGASTTDPSLSTSIKSPSSLDAGRVDPSGSTILIKKDPGVVTSTNQSLSPNRTKFLSDFSINKPSQDDYTKYYAEVKKNEPIFTETITKLAEEVSGNLMYRTKTQESLALKLFRKSPRGLGDMNDTLAATIITKNPEAAAKLAADKYGVSNVQRNNTFLGYSGIHSDYELPNGQLAEIQYHTIEDSYRKRYAHTIYDKWRKYIESNKASTYEEVFSLVPTEKQSEFTQDIDLSRRIFHGDVEIPKKYVDEVNLELKFGKDQQSSSVNKSSEADVTKGRLYDLYHGGYTKRNLEDYQVGAGSMYDRRTQNPIGMYFAEDEAIAKKFGTEIIKGKILANKVLDISDIDNPLEALKKLGFTNEEIDQLPMLVDERSYKNFYGSQYNHIESALKLYPEKLDALKQKYQGLRFLDSTGGKQHPTISVFNPKDAGNVAQPPQETGRLGDVPSTGGEISTSAPHLLKNQEGLKLEPQKNDGWCGPTALQYALKEQGLSASQEELAKGMGATISQGADPGQITSEAKNQGLTTETIQGEDAQKTLATLDQALSEGKSVILDFLDGKDLQNDGHYVLYQGRENGNITVMDPQTGKPRTIDEQKFIDQWKDTTIKGNVFKRWATILEKTPQVLGGKPDQPKKIVGRSKYATTGIREVLSSAESPQDSVNKLDAFVKDFVKGADQSNMADLRAGLVKEIDSLVGGTGNYKRDYAVRVAMRDDIEVGGLVRALEGHISDIDATIKDYPEKNVSPADDIVGSETSITIPAEVNQAGQTPVGQGKLRESTAYAKIKSRIAEEAQLDVKYNKVNLNADTEKAVQFLDENPKAAVRVALGLEKAPEGQLERNITIATAEKALADGDIALWNQIESSGSLRQTRRGQEIVADRGRFNDNSPHTFMKELISRRLDKLGYSFQQAIKDAGKKVGSLKESAIAKIDERTAKLREKLKKDQGKIKLAQDIIDLLRC